MFLLGIHISKGRMAKPEFSHREAFHRHLANIYNIKERNSLSAKSKYLEKCKEIRSYDYNREEKLLRRQLADLRREKSQLDQEGSCLDRETQEKIERLLREERESEEKHAEDVAARLLNRQQSPTCKPGVKRKDNKRSNPVQQSWHGRKTAEKDMTRLPTISKNRRHSIADPTRMTQQQPNVVKEKTANSKNTKSKHSIGWKQVQSQANVAKKISSKMMPHPSIPVVVVEPDDSLCSIHNETVIKSEDIHHPTAHHPMESHPGSHQQHHHVFEPRVGAAHHHVDPHAGTSSISTRRSSIIQNMDGKKRTIDQESLQHYYDLLAENERMLRQDNHDFETPVESHCPLGTLKRSNKRKLLALEALLMQLPSFKEKPPELDPISSLNCRYLRLSKQNVSDLEDELLLSGRDPGVHAHMNEQRVLDYYDTHQQHSDKGLTLEI